MLTRIANRQANRSDIERLRALCDLVKNTSLCGLGQSAPNPVLSTLRYFEKEYMDLINEDDGNGFHPLPLASSGDAKPKEEAGHVG
jgi:bidirectional [NiFe] hydrogenase diaphorase subunit